MEALGSGDFGLLDTLELVALGCVDRYRDCLSSRDLLEVVGIKTGSLVVDIHSVKRESLASCLNYQCTFQDK